MRSFVRSAVHVKGRAARLLGVLLLALAAACAAPAAAPPAGAPRGGVEAEARAFMEAYGRDLLAGDRAAIAARYDAAGAYFMGNGHKEFMPFEAIRARYAGPEWSAPRGFEWRDLSYEVAGPDAVVVTGLFAWGLCPGAPPLVMSYTGLLVRREGGLRIRLEDESVDPRTPPPAPCPGAR
jgi:hypothetical protein